MRHSRGAAALLLRQTQRTARALSVQASRFAVHSALPSRLEGDFDRQGVTCSARTPASPGPCAGACSLTCLPKFLPSLSTPVMCRRAAAERGHAEVIRAVVETLMSTTLDCIDTAHGGGHAANAKAGALGWSRFLRDHVVNARTAHGQTPLILACEQGCAGAGRGRCGLPEVRDSSARCVQAAPAIILWG